MMRHLEILKKKERMSEDALKFSFSGRRSYDKSLRKLLRLGLIETIPENEMALHSTWRMGW
jgi:hypothetical protein